MVRVDPSLAVTSECGSAGELLSLLARCQPDVLLLDQDLMGPTDLGFLQSLLSCHPRLRVLVLLTQEPADGYVGGAGAIGALGLVLRVAQPSLIIKALRAVASGHRWLQRELTDRLVQDYARAVSPIPPAGGPRLSRRQREILALLSQGLSNRDISKRLYISEKTVKAHLTALFRGLGVSSRTGAVCSALQLGVLSIKDLGSSPLERGATTRA